MARPIRPLSRHRPLAALAGAALVLWAAGATGCTTGLVRRPQGISPTPRPTWESEPVRIRSEADTAAAGGGQASARPAAATTVPPFPPRAREARERVRQVNEYALWCMERDLWDEAQLHLERALAVDSLAASLHNNMGIVYERLGRQEEALGEYRRARELRPRKAYAANLHQLQERIRAAEESVVPDSLVLRHEDAAAEPDSAAAPADSAATLPTRGD